MNECKPTEVITFRRGDRLATVVTDGENHRTYEFESCRSHGSLRTAIAYLETIGYQIDIDNFNGE